MVNYKIVYKKDINYQLWGVFIHGMYIVNVVKVNLYM